MPYALMHSATGELLSCPQVNLYQLKYYGIMLWHEMPEAEERLAALLRAERYRLEELEAGAAPAAGLHMEAGAEAGVGAGQGSTGEAADAKPRRRDRHEAEWEQVLELSRWQPVLLSEHEAKLANVRLRGDSGVRVFLREGRLEAEAIRREP
ncbi:hypothetical protein COLU111180_11670 [Cohnella lubricantis]|uniref:Uncharacterized protein n=1 Tax=Cohnella lubricantis TaxID=2163172 RepID=A0A841TCI0_9BACL|nr:hypothetical protein [Cohnella lubricantis]MBB6676161.1 hypothetical protein [Cohnella lubricantis]MBP2118647.1 regulator of protease activity HflC (stomatin/prohibitin superfamily) [Cohnella lubricantis]